MDIADYLVKIVPFPPQELADISEKFVPLHVSKGHMLVRRGQVCKNLYFIVEGLGRSYYLKDDGKEVTQWFFKESDFMSSADSFFNQSSSDYYVEVLEDSIIYKISYTELEALLTRYHRLEKFVRLLSIETLTRVADKLNAIQFQSAKERYGYMMAEFPDISQRVSLGHIASYLGMSQETLSRTRKLKD